VSTRLEETLARRLRELAKERKVPLSHVADRAGLARSYFWLLLDGSSSATLAVLQRIAEALSVEPVELLAPGEKAGDRAQDPGVAGGKPPQASARKDSAPGKTPRQLKDKKKRATARKTGKGSTPASKARSVAGGRGRGSGTRRRPKAD
jgi:transcriptional regulator with XRE-family HTH domain